MHSNAPFGATHIYRGSVSGFRGTTFYKKDHNDNWVWWTNYSNWRLSTMNILWDFIHPLNKPTKTIEQKLMDAF